MHGRARAVPGAHSAPATNATSRWRHGVRPDPAPPCSSALAAGLRCQLHTILLEADGRPGLYHRDWPTRRRDSGNKRSRQAVEAKEPVLTCFLPPVEQRAGVVTHLSGPVAEGREAGLESGSTRYGVCGLTAAPRVRSLSFPTSNTGLIPPTGKAAAKIK